MRTLESGRYPMGKQKSPTSTSPQVVATLSTLLLLVVSAGLGFYFTELRGPGFRTLLSGNQASELLVLLGGLAAVILTGHLAIANVVRSAQGTSGYRKLVRKASEIDHTNPEAVSQFDSFPELRDFLHVLIAEKQQGHQLQDSLESARGETKGLFAGMERSLKDLGKMREDQPSELGRKVSSLWNELIDRVQQAEAGNPTPGTSSKVVSSDGVTLGATAMEQRLRDLEARVEELLATGAAGATQLLVTEDEIVASQSRPLLEPEAAPEVIDLQGDLEPFSPLLSQEDSPDDLLESEVPVLEALEPLTDDELEDAGSPMAVKYSGEGSVIIEDPAFDPVRAPQPATAASKETSDSVEDTPTFVKPWQEDANDALVSGSAASTQESEAVSARADAVGAQPVVEVKPAVSKPEPETVGQGSVVEETDQEHVFTEWSGAGFASLSNLSQQTDVGFGTPTDSRSSAVSPTQPSSEGQVGFGRPAQPTPTSSRSSFTPTPTPEAQPTQETVGEATGMAFPKFGAPANAQGEDHVEVTYEGTTAAEKVSGFPSFDEPAEEAMIDEETTFEIEDDDVVDLRSLGAVETKE